MLKYSTASSRGRGNRVACWFADYLKSQNDTATESCVLEGGIKAWATAGKEYIEYMDGYETAAWQ
jgi:arsenical-resistance protein 2